MSRESVSKAFLALTCRLERLEGKQKSQIVQLGAQLANVIKECEYLRTHVTLLEARLDQLGRFSCDVPTSKMATPSKIGRSSCDVSTSEMATPSKIVVTQKDSDELRHVAKKEEPTAFLHVLHPSHTHTVTSPPCSPRHVATESLYSTATGSMIIEEMESYELQPNMWDVGIVIGLAGTGRVGSLLVAAVVVLNSVLQLVLCAIINDVFTVPEIGSEDVSRMRQWRVYFGHSTDLMNELTFEPYVKGVCAFEGGVQMTSDAVSLLDAIGQYLPDKQTYDGSDPVIGPILPHISYIGVLLSAIAVVIWMMQCATAVLSTRAKVLAICHMTRAEKTTIEKNTDSRQLMCVSTNRKVGLLLICFVEILVEVLLGFCGTFYIIRTLSLRDMLLNCSALVIVLECDELFFESLVPRQIKSMLMSFDPLPRPQQPHISGVTPSSFFSLFLIGFGVTGSLVSLFQQEATLLHVRHEICGGNQNFVARADSSGVLTAGFNPQEVDYDDFEGSYIFTAMRQLIANEDGSVVEHRFDRGDMSAASSGVTGGPWSLLGWTNKPLDATIEYWNPKCLDMLPVSDGAYAYSNHFLHMLQDAFGDVSIQDCMAVKKKCNYDDLQGVFARQLCPVTCGCDDPGPDLILLGEKGCSPTCYSSNAFNTSLWSRECEDLARESPYWPKYAEALLGYLSTYTAIGGFDPNEEAAIIEANGCDVVSTAMHISILGVTWPDPCKIGDAMLKPFTYACPVSCHCAAENPSFLCPAKCGAPNKEYLQQIWNKP